MTSNNPPHDPRGKAQHSLPSPMFTAGRDIKGAFATSYYAIATATMTETMVADRTIDIGATLETLRAQFAQIADIEPKALTRLNEAKDEAAKAEPAPCEVTTLVEQAIRYAAISAGFAGAIEKLAPHLKRVWDWAGITLPDWASALGLR